MNLSSDNRFITPAVRRGNGKYLSVHDRYIREWKAVIKLQLNCSLVKTTMKLWSGVGTPSKLKNTSIVILNRVAICQGKKFEIPAIFHIAHIYKKKEKIIFLQVNTEKKTEKFTPVVCKSKNKWKKKNGEFSEFMFGNSWEFTSAWFSRDESGTREVVNSPKRFSRAKHLVFV